MIALFCLCLALFASPFKSKGRLEAENAALRHQLILLRRKVRGRVRLTDGDRLFLIQLYRWFPSVLKAITIVRPETLVRWHRAGFRRYWRWKSRSLGGRPQIDPDPLMIELSKPITDAEIESAAAYFSALQPRKRIKVVPAALRLPACRPKGRLEPVWSKS